MRFTITSTTLVALLGASSTLAAPQISKDTALVSRDGILSTVGDAFQNVTGAIADGITNYTSAVGNATRNAVNDDDNAATLGHIPNGMWLALGGSIVTGTLLL